MCLDVLNCAVYGVYIVLRNNTAVSSMKLSNPVKIFCLIIKKVEASLGLTIIIIFFYCLSPNPEWLFWLC